MSKTNSALDAILNQYEKNKTKARKEVDLTKYFNTVLEKGKNSGKRKFRILPGKEGNSPFVEVYFHNLQVNGQWRKLYCPSKNTGDPCPLCEVDQDLMKTGSKEDKELAKQYRPRKFYVVKGIERGKEDEGVKFWRFGHNFKGDGILDKIIPIFQEKGDISDPETGRDLIITMTKDGKNSKVTSIVFDDKMILGNKSEMETWLNDEMSWEDVYSKPDYDYLVKVAKGEVPMWNDPDNKSTQKSKPTATDEDEDEDDSDGEDKPF